MCEKRTIFSASNLDLLEKMGKKEDILNRERGRISDPGERDKKALFSQNTTKVVFFPNFKISC